MDTQQALIKIDAVSATTQQLPAVVEAVAPLGGRRVLVGTYVLSGGGDPLRMEALLTRNELEMLFRYWVMQRRDLEHLRAVRPSFGSDESDKLLDTSRRMEYFRDLLGDPWAGDIQDEVYENYPSAKELAEERATTDLIWCAQNELGLRGMEAISARAWQGVPTAREVEALHEAARKREYAGYRAALAEKLVALGEVVPEQFVGGEAALTDEYQTASDDTDLPF